MWYAKDIKYLLDKELPRHRGACLRDVALHGGALYFIYSVLNIRYAVRFTEEETEVGYSTKREVIKPYDFGEYYDNVDFLYLDRKTYENLPL